LPARSKIVVGETSRFEQSLLMTVKGTGFADLPVSEAQVSCIAAAQLSGELQAGGHLPEQKRGDQERE